MLVNGKVSTNLFLAKGGRVLGQALAPASDVELRCTLLASAPFINSPEFGEDSIPLEASFGPHREEGRHLAATRRLNDATLIEPGTSTTVLSAPIDVPSRLEAMATTVRLTSCTVVGGSRDTGENQCKQSMTGRESSTVRIRIVARWLDADGEIRSRTTLWDETLAVDYNTHHLPWSLRQEQLAEHAPDGADSAVIVVQVESVAGTPVVAHADGTDAVVTIGS